MNYLFDNAKILVLVLVVALFSFPLFAEGNSEKFQNPLANIDATGISDFVFGDALPDAPSLSQRGGYAVGVRTLDLTNPNQIDILNTSQGANSRYDRPLTVEVWYPAILPQGAMEITNYHDTLGVSNNPQRPLIPFTFLGRSLRNADPYIPEEAFPLLIVSHGFPGSRLMMTYLTENLASKGYVVVAIDHTESTFSDVGPFPSTLLNRPLDILFVLDEIAELGRKGGPSFLSGTVDADNTALIGYSMGGYGSLNAAGAGFSSQAIAMFASMMNGDTSLKIRSTGNPDFIASHDDRIKAVVAFAPWGMNVGVWDAEGLAGLTVPTLFVAGSQDDVALYENGIKAIFEGAKNSDRYMLTFINARHNVAPNPPPAIALDQELLEDYYRYAEPSWNEHKINNINQHFLTAFLGLNLKALDYGKYLDLIEISNEGVFSTNADGSFKEAHSYWEGFKARSAVGMEFVHKSVE